MNLTIQFFLEQISFLLDTPYSFPSSNIANSSTNKIYKFMALSHKTVNFRHNV